MMCSIGLKNQNSGHYNGLTSGTVSSGLSWSQIFGCKGDVLLLLGG